MRPFARSIPWSRCLVSCLSSFKRCAGVGLYVGEHGSVDDVGESALEDAQAFPAAVATVLTAIEQFTSWLVTPGLSQGDAV